MLRWETRKTQNCDAASSRHGNVGAKPLRAPSKVTVSEEILCCPLSVSERRGQSVSVLGREGRTPTGTFERRGFRNTDAITCTEGIGRIGDIPGAGSAGSLSLDLAPDP